MDQQTPTRLRRTGSGRLPADEAARLPDRLLDAAAEIFMTQGYAKTTMDKIAKAAGASTKTVYARYRNKNEIAAAVLHRANNRAVPSLLGDVDRGSDNVEPRAFLTQVGERIAARVASDEAAAFYRLVVGEVPGFPELGDLYREGSGRFIALLSKRFALWHRTGRLSLSVKPEAAAQVFLDLVAATPRNRALLGIPLTAGGRKTHVANAVEIFFNGCTSARK